MRTNNTFFSPFSFSALYALATIPYSRLVALLVKSFPKTLRAQLATEAISNRGVEKESVKITCLLKEVLCVQILIQIYNVVVHILGENGIGTLESNLATLPTSFGAAAASVMLATQRMDRRRKKLFIAYEL